MSKSKRIAKDGARVAGNLIGNEATRSIQNATDSSIRGMDLFKAAAAVKQNVAFEQAKGNLFEFIEAAKFNKNAASSGEAVRAVVTEAVGRPHDPADIEIVNGRKVLKQVQAKFSDSKYAAADSVNMQRKDKYTGMQRLIRKEKHYTDPATGESTTLLSKSKQLAKTRAEKEGTVYQEQYRDVYNNLTDELHHGDVSSGGSTIEEVQKAYNNPDNYAKAFERRQVATEIKLTAANMAKANLVTTGVISGIANMFQVFSNEKKLAEAIKDIGVDAIEGCIKGGATGVISATIRCHGVKSGSSLLSDSTAATVMAGGIIDGGIALYSYAQGDISAEQLKDQLVDTTAKAATTIYFTKAVRAIMGKAVNPIFPMVVYTAASYVIACTREIITNAKLNTAEYERMAAVLQESQKSVDKHHEQFKIFLDQCEEHQRAMLDNLINAFDYNISTGGNYDEAIYAIVTFADRAGIALQHKDFNEFSQAMNSDEPFTLLI